MKTLKSSDASPAKAARGLWRTLFGSLGWFGVEQSLYTLTRGMNPALRQSLKPLVRGLWYGKGHRRLKELATSHQQVRPALSKYRVFCLPIIDWEFRTQRPQQLLARLAGRGCPVVYLRTDFGSGTRLGWTKLLPPLVEGLRLPGPSNLTIYGDPPCETTVNSWLNALEVEGVAGDGIVTTSFVQWPFWTPLAIAARRRWGWPVIYDCLDDHAAFATTDRATLELEATLLAESDLVIATSAALLEKCKRVARRCILVPNAGDVAHFSRGTKIRRRGRGEPIVVGYVGAISESFDVELVRRAAGAYPGWRFELVGLNSGLNLKSLAELGNVSLLGERTYDALPSLVDHFDVAMIPFKVTPLTAAVNPVKLYEYLAAGKPVVASSIPELEAFARDIYLARDPASFVQLLSVAIEEDNRERRASRVAVARANDWDQRVALIDREIRGVLHGGPSENAVAAPGDRL